MDLAEDMRLILPACVKQFIKRPKHDKNDTAAICETLLRSHSPFGPRLRERDGLRG